MSTATRFTVEIDFENKFHYLYFCGMVARLVDANLLNEAERKVASAMLLQNSSEPMDIVEEKG